MIKQVFHEVPGVGATDLGLALEVASERHAPQSVTRAQEVAPGPGAGRRASARRRVTARG
ncbi:hypothetical protein [Streptomyces sp. TRM70350]|uniref:hypothetical protein n=1 Tax=Streptomyces sp. TRM70350 TaxID=2856165 RepID=UPI001C444869|nr:hypothetical protein [Streptomyces sp. TRM70350]MBV7696843.1 hypothetical protein [Streptomyces sp. TRM70350]